MSAILKLDFQKRKRLRFPEVNNLIFIKKDPILNETTTVSLKEGETRTSSGPVHPPKGTNGRQKTCEIFHIYCIFFSGFMCQTTVFFGITKYGSLVLNLLAS